MHAVFCPSFALFHYPSFRSSFQWESNFPWEQTWHLHIHLYLHAVSFSWKFEFEARAWWRNKSSADIDIITLNRMLIVLILASGAGCCASGFSQVQSERSASRAAMKHQLTIKGEHYSGIDWVLCRAVICFVGPQAGRVAGHQGNSPDLFFSRLSALMTRHTERHNSQLVSEQWRFWLVHYYLEGAESDCATDKTTDLQSAQNYPDIKRAHYSESKTGLTTRQHCCLQTRGHAAPLFSSVKEVIGASAHMQSHGVVPSRHARDTVIQHPRQWTAPIRKVPS